MNETSVCYYGRFSSNMLHQPPPRKYLSLPFVTHFLICFLCISLLFQQPLFATATIATTVQNCGVTCTRLFQVASPLKHDRSRIRKQEGSCPIICVWLSFCRHKQAEEMWMWSALADWLSVLARGYKPAFPVIYRCGAVSHKASGWGRESERNKNALKWFWRKSIHTSPSSHSDPLDPPHS